jgi:peroxiredoxin
MDRRAIVLPIAAAIIAGLVAWRMKQETLRRQRPRPAQELKNLRAAPGFALTNQSGGQTKLGAYLGRTKIALYFTGGTTVLGNDQQLAALAEAQPALAAAGIQLLVVSPAPPQEVRQLQKRRTRPFAFPVLADIDLQQGVPTPAHLAWGLVKTPGDPSQSGLFLIDRAGMTEFSLDGDGVPGKPVPAADFGATLRRLVSGEWPM